MIKCTRSLLGCSKISKDQSKLNFQNVIFFDVKVSGQNIE
ncbi:hypothetical protein AS4_03970 [Acinetobacter guillouiae]|nr:hypothetical protein AS4_03970 [Acinetobacter guillouiae]